MTHPGARYTAATVIAALLAAYATTFARMTHNHFDAPTFIDPLEWVVTLTFLAAAYAAWNKREQLGALLIVTALFLFFAVQVDWLFRVPIGFGLMTPAALAFLFILPVTWKPK